MNQTVKFAYGRLDRNFAVRTYTYTINTKAAVLEQKWITRRVGVVKVSK